MIHQAIDLQGAQDLTVHDNSYRNALALGLSNEQARLLADAMVTSVNRGP